MRRPVLDHTTLTDPTLLTQLFRCNLRDKSADQRAAREGSRDGDTLSSLKTELCARSAKCVGSGVKSLARVGSGVVKVGSGGLR